MFQSFLKRCLTYMFLRYYIESNLDRLLDFNIFLINSKFWHICGKKVLIHIDYLNFITLPRFCWILCNCWCHKSQICKKSFFSFKIVKYVLGRSPRKWNGYPLQYSCLENFKDRGAWLAGVYGVTKSQTQLSD